MKFCYRIIPKNGKVTVEKALPVMPETNIVSKVTFALDVLMMTQTQNPGEKERTQHEFMALAKGAGHSPIRFECFLCNFCIMEFYK